MHAIFIYPLISSLLSLYIFQFIPTHPANPPLTSPTLLIIPPQDVLVLVQAEASVAEAATEEAEEAQ
jgi:hypothetical protein